MSSSAPDQSFYFLQNFSDLHAEVLQVVANCVSDTESFHLIHNGGGLTKLMEFASTPNTPEIQSFVVKCIAKVAQSCKQKRRRVFYRFGNCRGVDIKLTLAVCVFLFFVSLCV